MIPPKPGARSGWVAPWTYWRMFRRDILSAQPERLYRAKMAEFRTPFFRSFLVNEPRLVAEVLKERDVDFPKSARVTRGLEVLLGQSVFVTNGDVWRRQRRIIDPAFARGQVTEAFGAMVAAALAATGRMEAGRLDVEAMASNATADVIFRTLFSLPIEDRVASETYDAFRAFQRTQPVALLSALVPWWPVRHRRDTREAASRLRGLIAGLVDVRQAEILAGTAPDDLATRLMTTEDPETGTRFDTDEMVDQVAIFFLAGHETSASLLGWALWCLAAAPDWAERVADEADIFMGGPEFGALSGMPVTRAVLREVLRLYPPVPMMVREAVRTGRFRGRDVPAGAQIVVSPWFLQRNPRHWPDPDSFDPARWLEGEVEKAAYLPFSAGPRVCPGASFAMTEGAVLLAALMADWRFETLEMPVPVAHLTVRSRDGIFLGVSSRKR